LLRSPSTRQLSLRLLIPSILLLPPPEVVSKQSQSHSSAEFQGLLALLTSYTSGNQITATTLRDCALRHQSQPSPVFLKNLTRISAVQDLGTSTDKPIKMCQYVIVETYTSCNDQQTSMVPRGGCTCRKEVRRDYKTYTGYCGRSNCSKPGQ
jgi:hypothetical protein